MYKEGLTLIEGWAKTGLSDVNDWVKGQLDRIGLRKLQDYNEESGMSPLGA